MAIWDKIINQLSARLAANIWERAQVAPIIEARAYRQGFYKAPLKVKVGQYDDNIGLNYIGLIEARIISDMFGNGVKFDFEGDTETAQEQYITAFLEANKQEVLFHRAALSAGESGTGYLYIIPAGIIGKDGNQYPRLQLIDPALVKMDTLPEDYEIVVRYTIEYKFTDADGKEKARRRVIEHNTPQQLADGTIEGGNTWTVTDYISNNITGGRWEQVSAEVWPFDFAPILHWQNLPSAFDCYGEPDVTESLRGLQDRVNFLASNISKIIRLYAHPMRIGRGVSENNMKTYDSGPDKMLLIPGGPDVGVDQLEPLGDLASSIEFLNIITKAMYSTARVVDMTTYEDKLGSVTNFGLRVLYQDNLAMIATKRELMGDMLEELIRRILIITAQPEINVKVVWPYFLPVNEAEQQAALQADLNMGIVSKETVAIERGYDWEQEQERIDLDQENQDTALLRAFNRGGERGF